MGGQIEGSDEVLLGVRFGPFGVRSGHLGGQIWSFGVDLRISDVRSQDLGVDLAISGSQMSRSQDARCQISGSRGRFGDLRISRSDLRISDVTFWGRFGTKKGSFLDPFFLKTVFFHKTPKQCFCCFWLKRAVTAF